MKTFRMALIMALLAGPASAQGIGTNILPDTPAKTPDQIEREQAIERDYKETLKRIPDGKANSDPWGSVRGAEASRTTSAKTTAKTAAKTTAKTTAKAAPAKSGQAKTTQSKPAANLQ